MSFQGDSIFWVELDKIVPNPFQPRREFDEAKLKELAESIRMYGVLQPLTVTRRERSRDDGTFFSEYELIAGERRLRASRLAGLSQVPVIIRQGQQTEQEKLELAIIENLQREDLNAVDRAMAFEQLYKMFNLNHAQIAAKMGRSREYVSNTLRLLALPEKILTSLRKGELSEGHARALLMLADRAEEQDVLYREILLKKISVRETERISRKIATERVRKHKWRDTDATLIEIEKKFTESLGTRVQIRKTDFGGTVSIDYFDPLELQNILTLIDKKPGSPAVTSSLETNDAVSDTLKEEATEANEVIARLEENTPLERTNDEEHDSNLSMELPDSEILSEPGAVLDEYDSNLSMELPDSEILPEPNVVLEEHPLPPALDTLVTPPEIDTLVTVPQVRPREDIIEETSKELLAKINETRKESDDSDMYSIKNFNV